MSFNDYYDRDLMRHIVASGEHRREVGGMWEEMGRFVQEFLQSEGLTSESYLLDVGCGCLRIGIPLIEFLEPGHYFGIDISQELLDVGFDRELAAVGLQGKLPRESLLCDGEFGFGRFESAPQFEFALAQSLFTHLPLNHIRLCLSNLSAVMRPGGRLFASIFECRDGEEWSGPIVRARGGFTSYPARDPYHYQAADIRYCIRDLPWTATEPRDWNHPRDQALVVFTRI